MDVARARFADPRPVRGIAALTLALGLAACTGPLPAERLGLRPASDPGPFPLRLAPYLLDPSLPRPASLTEAEWSASPTPAPTTPSTPRAGTAAGGRPTATTPPSRRRGGAVNLTPRDLAPVHAWLGTPENGQWILADTVDVVVSKEFFSRTLTVVSMSGWLEREVRRDDRMVGDDELVTLTYMGAPGTEHAISAPRVQLGPGFMISARRVLRLRLAKTVDAARPVRVRVVATGRARRGRDDEVFARGDQLEVRGDLVWDGARRQWTWSAS